jgi:hypothetical protein
MSSALERCFIRAALRHYPDWQYAPHFIGFGRLIKRRILAYTFPRSILETTKPSARQRLSASMAYAYFQSTFAAEIKVQSMAKAALHDCCFLTMEDAEDFFRPAFLPKLGAKFFKHLAISLYELFCKKDDSCGSTWQVYQLCLRVFADELDSRKRYGK